VEKVGNYLKEDLAKPGYKSKHENTKRLGWLEWRSHGLPTSTFIWVLTNNLILDFYKATMKNL
jgi:hypothetical protein